MGFVKDDLRVSVVLWKCISNECEVKKGTREIRCRHYPTLIEKHQEDRQV
jgi:hypothetical protein